MDGSVSQLSVLHEKRTLISDCTMIPLTLPHIYILAYQKCDISMTQHHKIMI